MAARGITPALIYAITVAVCLVAAASRFNVALIRLFGTGQRGRGITRRALTKVVPEVSRGYARRREEFRGNNGSAVRLVPSAPRGIYHRERAQGWKRRTPKKENETEA